jgi:hypothetical protein
MAILFESAMDWGYFHFVFNSEMVRLTLTGAEFISEK